MLILIIFLNFCLALDVNECSNGEHTCTGMEDCVNTKGSFQCVNNTCPKYMNRVGSKYATELPVTEFPVSSNIMI